MSWQGFLDTLRRWFRRDRSASPDTPLPAGAAPAAGSSTPASNPPALPSVPAVQQEGRALAAYSQAVNEWNAFIEDLSKGTGIEKAELEKAQGVVKNIATAAGIAGTVATAAATVASASSAVPIVGQVVAAVGALITLIAGAVNIFYGPKGLTQTEKDAGVNIINRGESITGWRDGVYRFNYIPIYGPKVDQFVKQLDPQVLTARFTKAQWISLYNMIKQYPFGPPVPRVDVLNDGTFQYEYNKHGNNDLSYEAGQRSERYMARTKDPAEITTLGTSDGPFRRKSAGL
jgi:hypothetical protein